MLRPARATCRSCCCPLLNDLRAVRGGALLSEGTLLLLNLRSDEPARPASAFTGEAAIVELARRLRPRLQLALLGWIRAEHVEQNLDQLADIANEFEQAASAQPLFQLWWVVGALLEGLRDGGLEGNVSIKRLLGHVDRELRRLQEQGESRYASSPPVDLINNLLYYVAQATTSGARITAVRQSFRLQDVMNAQSTSDVDAAETLSAPSVRLMKTVAAAIREDLTRVKDVLDIFVRKGATHVEDLAPQLEMLRKISDTLGVLGLGALRTRVEDELESLKAIVERRIPPDDEALLSIAAALIAVEDTLDSQLLRLILPDAGSAAALAGRADRRRIPCRAGRRAARMHREHGAHQGSGHAIALCAGGGARARPGAATGARHHGRAAHAGQAACRRGHGRSGPRARFDRAPRCGVALTAPARASGGRRRGRRVLHGDVAGWACGPVAHARGGGSTPRRNRTTSGRVISWRDARAATDRDVDATAIYRDRCLLGREHAESPKQRAGPAGRYRCDDAAADTPPPIAEPSAPQTPVVHMAPRWPIQNLWRFSSRKRVRTSRA